MSKNIPPEKHKEIMAELGREYPAFIKEIDQAVDDIADRATQFNPLALLQRSYFSHVLFAIGKQPNTQFDLNEAYPLQVLDYIQSIIVSRQQKDTRQPTDEEYLDLQSLIGKLYARINVEYHIRKGAQLQITNPNYSFEQDAFHVRAQLFWMNVSVDRYSIHNTPFIRELIKPHSPILVDLFGISGDELTEALASIQQSLTQGLFSAYVEIDEIRLRTLDEIGSNLSTSKEDFQSLLGGALDKLGFRDRLRSAMNRVAELDLFDLQKTTKLPLKLLDALSLAPGEDQSFFSPGDYRGWPLRQLPIRSRPFLKFDGKHYCFNNYNLQDNVYRSLQMLVTAIKPDYKPTWNARQKEVSERLPLEMLERLLPGSRRHSSIQYQWTNKSTGRMEWAEADGIVIFDDVLLAIEVKGGIFTPASPTTDLPAYIASIRNLVCTPAIQARRFIDELDARGELELFDEKRQPIGRIRKSDFWRIWGVCVTVDNISDIGTRHADFKNVGLSFVDNPTWIVSIDDLRIFCDLFDSGATFIHYLEQRLRVFRNPKAHPDDELDFIGMFFVHNDINMHTKSFGDATHIVWHGYRDIVDKYYYELISGGSPKKPSQRTYEFFARTLSRIEESAIPGRLRVYSWLMDLGDEGRQQFDSLVRQCLEFQASTKRIRPAIMMCEERYILAFCMTPEIAQPSETFMREYAISLVSSMQGKDLLVLRLNFNGEQIASAHGEILGQQNLSEIEPNRLAELREKYSQSRIAAVKKSTGRNKVGRNEKCPCGSGLKFKLCHGQKK
ncbi:SEC-C metal-binding domain-containing protein [Stigmatella aurantiaca]|nr:SEC-C metal-binding domain-containing protein [Stigmatella aurantiaca]